MTRHIGLVVGFGCALLGCGGISEEKRERDTPSSNGGKGGERGSRSLPPSVDCATNETDHCVSASGNIAGWPYDFACTVATDWARVHSFFGDQLHCESHDSNGVAVRLTFPSIDDDDLGPGPFDFRFAPFEPSAKIEVLTRSAGANLTSHDNFEAGRLSGTLEEGGDVLNVVYTYSGTFEATWSSCPEGCNSGAVVGTFHSVFRR